jgi:hypothetical protein
MRASPKIKATFLLGSDGRPELVQQDNVKHYKIRLQVDDTPDGTYAVTYVLDKSYRTPIREVLDKKAGFAEELTSYGDYQVEAKIRTRDGAYTVSTTLSGALKAGHREHLTSPIAEALQQIQSN